MVHYAHISWGRTFIADLVWARKIINALATFEIDSRKLGCDKVMVIFNVRNGKTRKTFAKNNIHDYEKKRTCDEYHE